MENESVVFEIRYNVSYYNVQQCRTVLCTILWSSQQIKQTSDARQLVNSMINPLSTNQAICNLQNLVTGGVRH